MFYASLGYQLGLLSVHLFVYGMQAYVLTRPRSMAKGDLFHIFFPYAKYITLDPALWKFK